MRDDGEKLRQIMEKEGITERELAEALGCHRKTVAQYKRAFQFRRATAAKLAEALGVSQKRLTGV